MDTGNSTPIKGYWLCPLYSFDCYSKSVDLVEGIQIKRITVEFADYLVRNHPDWMDKKKPKHMVILPYDATSKNEATGEEITFGAMLNATTLLIDLVTALRLCHSGMVNSGPIIAAERPSNGSHTFGLSNGFPNSKKAPYILPYLSKHEVEIKTRIDISTSKDEVKILTIEPTKYEFKQADVPKVNKSIGEIRDYIISNKPTVLREALRRFNSAYHGELEGRLVDQMIAFESLYIADDKELGYKLALRTAFLLGKKRAKIFSDMKKAYALRGQIVHGNKKVERSELEKIIPKTEECLRQSIRRFLLLLSQGKSLKEIREKLLDENILKNGKVLALKE